MHEILGFEILSSEKHFWVQKNIFAFRNLWKFAPCKRFRPVLSQCVSNFSSDYYPWITPGSRGRWFNGGSSWRNQYNHPNPLKLTKVSSTNSIVSWHRISPAVTFSKARSKARSQVIGLFSLKRGKRDLRSLASSSANIFARCHWRWSFHFLNGPGRD